MKIVYYVHDLEFPLVEGVRKQAWWLALSMKKQGHEVEIVSTSKRNKTIQKEGIKIRYGSFLKISGCRTDIIHYISHPSPLIVPLLFRVKAHRQVLTFFCGGLNGFWKRIWYKSISFLVNKKIDFITVQTEYQASLLKKTIINVPVRKIPPLIPYFSSKHDKSKVPTLLFMSHLTDSKGIKEVLKAFDFLYNENSKLKLIIADSGLKPHKFNFNNPGIITKNIVDPEEELAKCWIYLYPITQAQETFSVPLSLIEATQMGTSYISTSVGGINEYFPSVFLVRPKDHIALSQKIKEILFSQQKPHMLQTIDNGQVVKRMEELYLQ